MYCTIDPRHIGKPHLRLLHEALWNDIDTEAHFNACRDWDDAQELGDYITSLITYE